jgi:hypothetical protein
MRIEVMAVSIHHAFFMFKNELLPTLDKKPNKIDKFINIDEYDIQRMNLPDLAEAFENKGILFGYTEYESGENPNKVHVSLINHPVKGDKKWETAYVAVYDNINGAVVKDSRSLIKKECIDKGRAAAEKEKRHVAVLIGKTPKEFSRLETEILYRPSPNQKLGKYIFIW